MVGYDMNNGVFEEGDEVWAVTDIDENGNVGSELSDGTWTEVHDFEVELVD